MKRTASVMVLAGMLGAGSAAAQDGGDVTCSDFLLMNDQEQGRIALELVETPEGLATTTDVEGDFAIGTVEGLVTACEADPERSTAEIAAEIFEDQDEDGTPEGPMPGEDMGSETEGEESEAGTDDAAGEGTDGSDTTTPEGGTDDAGEAARECADDAEVGDEERGDGREKHKRSEVGDVDDGRQ